MRLAAALATGVVVVAAVAERLVVLRRGLEDLARYILLRVGGLMAQTAHDLRRDLLREIALGLDDRGQQRGDDVVVRRAELGGDVIEDVVGHGLVLLLAFVLDQGLRHRVQELDDALGGVQLAECLDLGLREVRVADVGVGAVEPDSPRAADWLQEAGRVTDVLLGDADLLLLGAGVLDVVHRADNCRREVVLVETEGVDHEDRTRVLGEVPWVQPDHGVEDERDEDRLVDAGEVVAAGDRVREGLGVHGSFRFLAITAEIERGHPVRGPQISYFPRAPGKDETDTS